MHNKIELLMKQDSPPNTILLSTHLVSLVLEFMQSNLICRSVMTCDTLADPSVNVTKDDGAEMCLQLYSWHSAKIVLDFEIHSFVHNT